MNETALPSNLNLIPTLSKTTFRDGVVALLTHLLFGIDGKIVAVYAFPVSLDSLNLRLAYASPTDLADSWLPTSESDRVMASLSRRPDFNFNHATHLIHAHLVERGLVKLEPLPTSSINPKNDDNLH